MYRVIRLKHIWSFCTWVTISSHDLDMHKASEYHIMILNFSQYVTVTVKILQF